MKTVYDFIDEAARQYHFNGQEDLDSGGYEAHEILKVYTLAMESHTEYLKSLNLKISNICRYEATMDSGLFEDKDGDVLRYKELVEIINA